MTNLQLYLTIGIPSLLVILTWYQGSTRFNAIEARIDGVKADTNSLKADITARFNRIELQLDKVQSELSAFNRDIGRHEAEIVNLKARR